MKTAAILLFFTLGLVVLPATAADRPVSKASIKRLIEVTNSRKMLDDTMSQMDGMMKASLKNAASEQSMTPEQESVMFEMQEKLADLLKEELNWESLEPMFIEIYRKTFTQKEVDAMLAFYKTQAGQALIIKMPVVMQATMQAMHQRMTALMPKIQQISVEMDEKMKKLSSQKSGD